MDILLVNTTPVVSRLLSLCMRSDEVVYEEVSDVHAAKREEYDIIFVDEASYMDKMKNRLEQLKAYKRVYLTSDRDENINSFFNRKVVKPFLPSQIMEIINANLENSKDIPSSSDDAKIAEDGKIVPTQMSDFMNATEEKQAEVEEKSEASFLEKINDKISGFGKKSETSQDDASLLDGVDAKKVAGGLGAAAVAKTVIDKVTNSHEDVDETSSKKLIIEDIVKTSEAESTDDIRIFDVDDNTKSAEILNTKEVNKIKDLLAENEKINSADIETLSEVEQEKRKIEAITEQLQNNGLDILDEKSIIKELQEEQNAKKKAKAKKSQKTNKSKKNTKSNFSQKQSYSYEDLADISNLSAKKIRKILKNLRINISIEFEEKS